MDGSAWPQHRNAQCACIPVGDLRGVVVRGTHYYYTLNYKIVRKWARVYIQQKHSTVGYVAMVVVVVAFHRFEL